LPQVIGSDTLVMTIEKSLTESERKLIQMMIDQTHHRDLKRDPATLSSIEACQQWLEDGQAIPPSSILSIHWEVGKVPLLLEAPKKKAVTSNEIVNLVNSYLKENEYYDDDEELCWILSLSPQHLLLLVPITSLIDEEVGEDGEHETTTMVVSWAEGLRDLLQSEVGQSYRIGFTDPVYHPAKLADVYRTLAKCHELAKKFKWKKRIYSDRDLAMLQLLQPLSLDELTSIISRLWSAPDQTLLQDKEFTITLDHFFEESLNVSETARKLYVHRNTLLYRLEKFRLETGYDVRKFDDALIVRLSLLLIQAIQTK
ncbi:MAG: helix-turn-helix domain-containing protein, partial [Bacilli bacterium]